VHAGHAQAPVHDVRDEIGQLDLRGEMRMDEEGQREDAAGAIASAPRLDEVLAYLA
jgi:hypothetical protein